VSLAHREREAPDAESDAARATTRILFALNARERAFFLPKKEEVELDGSRSRWFDTGCDSAELWAETLESWNPQVLVSCWSTPALPESYLTSADCALDYVCNITGSVRKVTPRSFLERGGQVSNWGDLAGAQVAEHALLLALGALRGAYAWRSYIEGEDGRPRYQAAELKTATLFRRRVGLHGFGRIARSLVKLLKPFGVQIHAFSDQVPAAFIREHGVEPAESLEDLFSGSEVLFECEALTPASRHSITAQLLRKLPDDAVFVNVGRGAVVDESALLAESSRLRLALDVLTHEPVAAGSPWADAPRTLLSPHIGGPTFDHYRKCGKFALSNLKAYLGGGARNALISLDAYARST
jgi:phosphoglycerate dehydrogenase-like enzyme